MTEEKKDVGLTQTPEEFQFWEGIVNEGSQKVAKEKIHECYIQIREVLDYYLDMSETNKRIVALWIIGSYFHKEMNTWPILFFNAMKGSGKTRSLKLVSALSAGGQGDVLNSVTEAVIFRLTPHNVVCLDEIERIGSKDKAALRELLNSAYKKGAKVRRMKKVKQNGEEKQVVEEFELFLPIAMANIWGIEEVLADRALTLILEKSNDPLITSRMEDFRENELILHIKRTLVKCSVQLCSYVGKKTSTEWNRFLDKLHNYTIYTNNINYTNYTNNTTTTCKDNEVLFNKIASTGINGRNLEIFFPLFLIADIIGDNVLNELLSYAQDLVKEKREDELNESKDVLVIDFISRLDNSLDYQEVRLLTSQFRQFIGEEDLEDKWLNEKWLGRAMKRLGLILDKRRNNKGIQVVPNIAKAKSKMINFRKGLKENFEREN